MLRGRVLQRVACAPADFAEYFSSSAVLLHSYTSARPALPIACEGDPAGGQSAVSNRPLAVGFIGAGGINFGTPTGCWNHARHLERFEGVTFSAVCDLRQSLAQQRISEKLSGDFGHKWQNCKAFANHHEMLDSLGNALDAVIIGTPSHTRGALNMSGGSMELDMAMAGVHVMVEKPISVRPYEEVAEISARLDECHRKSGTMVGVGYMLRYAGGVELAKQLLARAGTEPISLVSRMVLGHSCMIPSFYWDMQTGGPMVESASHVIDLMRYFSGEIVPGSISALAIGPNMVVQGMPEYPNGEHMVPVDRRVNRSTSAVFNFENGAIGNLFHVNTLEGTEVTAELDIYGDGIHIAIGNPYGYGKPSVRIRSSRNGEYEQVQLPEQGIAMYEANLAAFVRAVRTGDASHIKSPFADALKTYQASRWIADASKQTPPTAWNATTPWITRSQPDHR